MTMTAPLAPWMDDQGMDPPPQSAAVECASTCQPAVTGLLTPLFVPITGWALEAEDTETPDVAVPLQGRCRGDDSCVRTARGFAFCCC